MDKRKFEIEYTVFENRKELVEEDRMLIEKAKEISVNAYVPYSGFRVGVAVLLDNGKVLTANNQENASYPEGLCAERVVLFYAMSQYPDQKIKSIAVFGNPQKFTLTHFISPCGGCRQVMYEYEYRSRSKMRILLSGISGETVLVEGVENLLPFPFSVKDLSIHEEKEQ
ncbi:MAG: cytidine deaminase [Bacteroidales bacterium]|jgi:cytidine deaminase|nr:cytidine deaminase [Bacteroidales bacterium]